jgi:hypothetical protein
MTATRTVTLPAPRPDGTIDVAPYLLNRWENRGLITLCWIDRTANTTGYVINGRRYRYDGTHLAPRAPGATRRRTFFVATLVPVAD